MEKFKESDNDGVLDSSTKLTLPHTTSKISTMAFDPHQNRLATVGSDPDYLITIWELQSGAPSLRSKAFSQDTYCLQFHPQLANTLVTCGVGHLKYWRIANTFTGLKLQGTIGKFAMAELCDITSVIYLDEFRVLTGTNMGMLLLWESGIVRTQISAKGKKVCHDGAIDFLKLVGDDIITGGHDGYIRRWSRKPFDSIGDSDPFLMEIDEITAISTDGAQIRQIESVNNESSYVIQDCRGKILKFNQKNQEIEVILSSMVGPFLSFDMTKSGSLYAVSNRSGTVQVSDYSNNRSIDTLKVENASSYVKFFETTANQQLALFVGDVAGYLTQFKYGTRGDAAAKFHAVERVRPFSAPVSLVRNDSLNKYLLSVSGCEMFIFKLIEKDDNISLSSIGSFKMEKSIKDAFFINVNSIKFEVKLFVVLEDGKPFYVTIPTADTKKGSYELTNVKPLLLTDVERIHSVIIYGASNSFLASHNPPDKLALTAFVVDDAGNITSRKIVDFPLSTKLLINKESSSLLSMDEEGNIWRYLITSPPKADIFSLNIDMTRRDMVKTSCQIASMTNHFGISFDGQSCGIASADGNISFSTLVAPNNAALSSVLSFKSAKIEQAIDPNSSSEADKLTLEQIKLIEYRKLEYGEFQAAREKLQHEIVALRQQMIVSIPEKTRANFEFDAGLKEYYVERFKRQQNDLIDRSRKDIEQSEHIHKRIVTFYMEPFVETQERIVSLNEALYVDSFDIFRHEMNENINYEMDNCEYLPGHLRQLLRISNFKIKELKDELTEKASMRKTNLDQRSKMLEEIMEKQPSKQWEDENKLKSFNAIIKQISGHSWKTETESQLRILDAQRKLKNVEVALYEIRNLKTVFNAKFHKITSRKSETLHFIKQQIHRLKQLYSYMVQKKLITTIIDFESIVAFDKLSDLNLFTWNKSPAYATLCSLVQEISTSPKEHKLSIHRWNQSICLIVAAQKKFDKLLKELFEEKNSMDCEINIALMHIAESNQDISIIDSFDQQTLDLKTQLGKLKSQKAEIQKRLQESAASIVKIKEEAEKVEMAWKLACDKFKLDPPKNADAELLASLLSLGKDIPHDSLKGFESHQIFLADRLQKREAVRSLREQVRIIEIESESSRIENANVSDSIKALEESIRPQEELKAKAVLDSIRWVPMKPTQVTGQIELGKSLAEQQHAILFDQRTLSHIEDMTSLATKTIETLKIETNNFKAELKPVSDDLEKRRAVLLEKEEDLINLQLSKFGKPIDLRELEALRTNEDLIRQKEEIKKVDIIKAEELARIDREYQTAHDGLRSLLEENTALMKSKHTLLENIVKLQEKIYKLENQKKEMQSGEHDEIDVKELEAKLQNYTDLIANTKREILQLCSKSPNSHPVERFAHSNALAKHHVSKEGDAEIADPSQLKIIGQPGIKQAAKNDIK